MSQHDDIQAVRDEVAALRAQLAQLTNQHAVQSVDIDDATEPAVTRRGWMKAAAGAAVGGTALALAGSQRVAAANNDPILIGNSTNTATNQTTGTKTGAGGGTSFLFRSGTAFSAGDSAYPSALGGWGMLSQQTVGIYGYSNQTGGQACGVVGVSVGSGTVGVRGRGPTAVEGIGSVYGVEGRGNSAAFHAPATTTTAPPNRTNAHAAGEIESSGSGTDTELWLCVASGTPGTWRKIGGATTAGALHPIDPARVYDSRLPAPTPGRLSSGANRVVSVADARNPVSGAVTVADLVPAGATAVAYNLTLDATANSGFLGLTPGDSASSPSSSINWYSSNQIVANAGIVKLDDSRQVKVFAGGGGSTHFLIDITGFYI